jgi:hypothetical protein
MASPDKSSSQPKSPAPQSDQKSGAGITPRSVSYSDWYLDIIHKAELAEHSAVRGCMVIRPHGYGIWEKMQRELRRPVQGHGSRQRVLPAVHPAVVPDPRRRPSTWPASPRSARSSRTTGSEDGGSVPTARPASSRIPRASWKSRWWCARRARPSSGIMYKNGGFRFLAGSADSHQPVGQRGPLGAEDAPVPPHRRVPVAGRAHCARDGSRGASTETHADARRLRRTLRSPM